MVPSSLPVTIKAIPQNTTFFSINAKMTSGQRIERLSDTALDRRPLDHRHPSSLCPDSGVPVPVPAGYTSSTWICPLRRAYPWLGPQSSVPGVTGCWVACWVACWTTCWGALAQNYGELHFNIARSWLALLAFSHTRTRFSASTAATALIPVPGLTWLTWPRWI
ncbi:hypothetical protein BD289DRAFT_423981 [Coniella lustricola]|uniref:Uncharacterized protein n=1 Tax=Coniella lustricola TaxID=2025994 RepID=A0A2T3AJ55_9PEZI|nr:hypothetical protein BD289DRAFT_423981 [Coniella lustricola]